MIIITDITTIISQTVNYYYKSHCAIDEKFYVILHISINMYARRFSLSLSSFLYAICTRYTRTHAHISQRYRVIRATRVQRPRFGFIDEVRRVFVAFRLISKVREPWLGYKREYSCSTVLFRRCNTVIELYPFLNLIKNL